MLIGIRHLLWAGSLLSVTACVAGGSIGSVSGEYLSPFYAPSLVSYEAQDGRFPLVIRGNPFGGVPQAALEQSIHQNARLPGWAPQARFFRDDAAEQARGLRMVVLFNAPGQVDFRAICSDLSGIGLAGPANQLVIHVAFCDGPQAMSEVSLRTAPAPAPDSASFIGALNTSIGRALPFIDRARQGT